MKKRWLIILVSLTCLCLSMSAFAETIVLKSGKTITGKLIEKTDEYIKIDFQGVSLTYFLDEIESIEGQDAVIPGAKHLLQSSEQLQVIIVASLSPNFINEWMGSGFSHVPGVKIVKEIERNQEYYEGVIVGGYGVDAAGRIDLIGDYIVLDPNGKEIVNNKSALKVKVDKEGQPGGFLMMSPYIKVMFDDSEPLDPLGSYTIKAVVTDNILHKTVIGEYKITLKEKTEKFSSEPVFYSEQEYAKWMTYYYLQPEPDKVIAAIKFYSDSNIFNKASSRLPAAAFFAAIFKGNNDLMKKAYEEISANGSDNSKIVLLRVLWLVNNKESKELINKANLNWKSDQIKKHIYDVLNNTPPDIFKDPIKDPTQLDMLWATFLATGDSAPVERIISALHFLKDGHGFDIAIGGAAQWSLESNAIQHRKVYQICQEELKNADGETKKILQKIITKVGANG